MERSFYFSPSNILYSPFLLCYWLFVAVVAVEEKLS